MNLLSKLCLLSLAFCSVTMAGTPDQDMVIVHMRNLMAKGVAPRSNSNDLHLNLRWRCLWRSAQRNDYSESFDYLSFSPFDGLVMPHFWDGPNWADKEISYMWQSMTITNRGLEGTQGVPPGENRKIYGVMDSSQENLILELSTLPSSSGEPDVDGPTSIFDSRHRVIGYFLCPVNQIVK
ncbi:MAG: hypothetical protein ACXVCP_09620 [Bdellovibrio sp.]